jgi:hypothetical protein
MSCRGIIGRVAFRFLDMTDASVVAIAQTVAPSAELATAISI